MPVVTRSQAKCQGQRQVEAKTMGFKRVRKVVSYVGMDTIEPENEYDGITDIWADTTISYDPDYIPSDDEDDEDDDEEIPVITRRPVEKEQVREKVSTPISIIKQKAEDCKTVNSKLNSITDLLRQTRSKLIHEELTFQQRKLTFDCLASYIELMYYCDQELPKLYLSNQTHFTKLAKSILIFIHKTFKSIVDEWETRFSPQSSNETEIINVLLEALQSTEMMIAGYLPEVERQVVDIDSMLYLP